MGMIFRVPYYEETQMCLKYIKIKKTNTQCPKKNILFVLWFRLGWLVVGFWSTRHDGSLEENM